MPSEPILPSFVLSPSSSRLTDVQVSQIGAIVTYRFQEYTKDKIPRFPRYVGERIDADKPKDAVVPSPPSRVSQS
jgi:hypothetical protein